MARKRPDKVSNYDTKRIAKPIREKHQDTFKGTPIKQTTYFSAEIL